jgi:hypothetical protein
MQEISNGGVVDHFQACFATTHEFAPNGLVYDLFNDVVSHSDYIQLNDD